MQCTPMGHTNVSHQFSRLTMHGFAAMPYHSSSDIGFHLPANDCKSFWPYLHNGKQFHRASVSYLARFTSKLAASSLASTRRERFFNSSATASWGWLESTGADKLSTAAPSAPSWKSD